MTGIRLGNRRGAGSGPVPFDPLLLSPYHWWQFSDSATVTLNGATISQVDDKAAAADATQGTAGNQPTLSVAGLNGLDFAQFDGTTDRMTATVSVAQPFMAFAVAQCDTNPLVDGGNRIVFQGSGPDNAALYVARSAGVTRWSVYAGSTITSTEVNDFGWHVITALFNGASSTMRIDGVQVGGVAAVGALGVGTSIALGAVSGAGGSFWSGGQAELLLGPVVSNELRDAYEASLMDMYGIV